MGYLCPVAELLHEGDCVPVDLQDLSDRIQRGEVPGHAQLRHAPWTGEDFQELARIPQLAEDFKAPGAAMARRFANPPRAWVSISVSALIVAFGLLQVAAQMGWLAGMLPFFSQAGVGYDALAFDGRWWTPWTSQLTHANFALHLLGNMAVIGYSGYRCERALGRAGYLAVAGAALLVGALAVSLLQRIPVIGSSILAFGLLGAQLAIGFRFGDTLPPDQRRYYGFGNLALAFVLVANTLTVANVSHAAHVGGFLGGVLAAGLHKPAFLSREEGWRMPAAVAALCVSPLLLGPVLRHLPYALWSTHEVMLEEVGASLELPGRLLPDPGYEVRVRGMPAWRTNPNSDELLFCGLAELTWSAVEGGDPLVGEVLEEDWGRLIDGTATEVSPPEPRGPGWTAHALEFADEDGIPRYLLIEHHRLQGVWLNRVGYLVALDGDGEPGHRAPVFRDALTTLQVGEPPELAQARTAHLENPVSSAKAMALAVALEKSGDLEQADGLYARVISKAGREQGSAVRQRLAMQARTPQRWDLGAEPWFMAWVRDYPGDRGLARDAVELLAAQGRCLAAREVHEALIAHRPDDVVGITTAGRVAACEDTGAGSASGSTAGGPGAPAPR